MKNINNYQAEKYITKQNYMEVEKGIYEYKEGNERIYVTSLSFVLESEYNEKKYNGEISQYPLEDILDEFYCYISDFYNELNIADSKIGYLEFASTDLEDIKNLRNIIGKHVYNKEYQENGNTYVKLMIE